MVLSGEHLTLRPWLDGDAPALSAACGDPDITRYTTMPLSYSPDAARVWIADQRRRTALGQALILAIVPAKSRRPVGMAGLFGLTERDGPRLGYWIVRAHRGRGLATEAAALLVSWAATQGHRTITLELEPHNVASRAVARRLGGMPRDPHTIRLDDGRTVALDRFVIRP